MCPCEVARDLGPPLCTLVAVVVVVFPSGPGIIEEEGAKI